MGGVLSFLFGWLYPSKTPALTNLDTTPDPNTGLSELDKHLIKTSWSLVADKTTLKQNGVEFFIQLFAAYPYMLKYFKDFAKMDEGQLRKSARLRAHASGVMHMITSYVENLDDTETLVELVKKLVTSHLKRKITVKEFEDLKAMFVPYLRTLLGKQVTSEMEEAWSRLLTAQNAIYKSIQDEKADVKDE